MLSAFKNRLFVSLVIPMLYGCATAVTAPTESERQLENCRISLNTSRLQRDDCDAELEKTGLALQNLEAYSQSQIADCVTMRELQDDRLLATEQALAQCRQTGEIANENLSQLRRREQDLRRNLEEQIELRDVEVQLLMDRLSVRVLDKILFKSGSAEILPTGLNVLELIANAIREGEDIIRIEGHTDNVPIGPNLKHRYPSNWELAAMRAASVIRFMQFGQGIAPERLMLVSWSKYQPIATNETDSGRQRNRRVEIVIGGMELR